MPTIKDVAKRAGVSIATVSYALNDKLDMVSEETRRQVLSTAREMGYRPNVTARNLQAKSTGLIGYAWHIAPEELESSPMMAQFMFHLAQAVEAAGYHMLTFTHPADEPVEVYDDLIRLGAARWLRAGGDAPIRSARRLLAGMRNPVCLFWPHRQRLAIPVGRH